MPLYSVVVITPHEAADAVRSAIADAGAGMLGHYDSCSFSIDGTGRFRGDEKSHPAVGEPGKLEQVQEERIEVVVEQTKMNAVLKAAVDAHPYEEPAIYVFAMEDYKDYL
jgi:hypothetical protein